MHDSNEEEKKEEKDENKLSVYERFLIMMKKHENTKRFRIFLPKYHPNDLDGILNVLKHTEDKWKGFTIQE